MKKTRFLSLILCVVLLISAVGTAAFAADGDTPDDKAELVEKLKAFEKEHPEFETAYYDILDTTDLILREEIAKAFRSVQREWKKKIMAQEETNEIPVEDRQRFAGLFETMAFIVDRDFTEHYKSAFVLDKPEYFNGSGKTETQLTANYDDAYQAIAETFKAFLAERGRDGEEMKELFKEMNLSISKAMDTAFEKGNERLKESFEEIAEDYNFSDEDKAFVGGVMTGLLKDINASFKSSFAKNNREGFDPESAIK